MPSLCAGRAAELIVLAALTARRVHQPPTAVLAVTDRSRQTIFKRNLSCTFPGGDRRRDCHLKCGWTAVWMSEASYEAIKRPPLTKKLSQQVRRLRRLTLLDRRRRCRLRPGPTLTSLGQRIRTGRQFCSANRAIGTERPDDQPRWTRAPPVGARVSLGRNIHHHLWRAKRPRHSHWHDDACATQAR